MAKRKTKTNKIHYVDNAKFLEAMIEYKREYNKSKENNKELPQISEYSLMKEALMCFRMNTIHLFRS